MDEFFERPLPTKEVIDSRRHIVQGYRKFQTPNEFGGMLQDVKSIHSGDQLQGIGCSSGEIEAKVRVILSVENTSELLSGEVLVTRFTDPGWTPVMARASAVITEVGGVLSHAAVIGREYGIPAVLNAAQATSILHTGDKVRVNGRTGLVTILKEKS
jgi:phosphoenolpyruvate synthase/pyruvate phosphate dikinase